MNRRILFYIVLELLISLAVVSSITEDSENFVQSRKTRDALEEPTSKVNYTGNQIWKTKLINDQHKKVIMSLRNQGLIQTWGGNRTSLDILVNPINLNEVADTLRNNDILYNIIIDNLQQAIEDENPPITHDNEDRQGHRMTWNSYHRTSDIWGFIDYLAQTFPDFCKVFTIGQTHEKRDIKVLKISNGKVGNKAVWIDGGMHAREWISPAVVTYIINQLVYNLDNEPDYMQNIDYYIAPVMNPDGYEYSHTIDRIWRKNRRPNDPTLSGFKLCYGTDLNRNFGYKWGLGGTSKDPCDVTYGGTRPFSELESKAMKEFIQGTAANWKAYISFHSYGQYILYPWGYASAVTTDYKDLQNVAHKAGAAIRAAGGPTYTIGPAASTLYPAAGGSDDWAKGVVRMKYSYTIELRDDGRYGFVLPASYIQVTSKEALAAVRVIVEAASQA
ncbi:unnamed protein product [Psylliodes chrysocephalus]|uniref:Peptidase M14 domain-containing protein n=1 Tax=Psylliodes chrysocephalus TaxID=3402493 RepID=A0A9P0CJT9_9CUCU|nr:unnamed protein product [Psylliodes chrysocephala]